MQAKKMGLNGLQSDSKDKQGLSINMSHVSFLGRSGDPNEGTCRGLRGGLGGAANQEILGGWYQPPCLSASHLNPFYTSISRHTTHSKISNLQPSVPYYSLLQICTRSDFKLEHCAELEPARSSSISGASEANQSKRDRIANGTRGVSKCDIFNRRSV